MTAEIRLLGNACNLGCTYCYQEPMRLAGNVSTPYDLEKVFEQIDKLGHEFSLFGGEALLVPKKDLEAIWKYGYEKFGKNGIQTNGTLIDDDHIELFKKYKVSVGISIDGPNELNGLREVRVGEKGSKEKKDKTLEMTKIIMSNIEKLAKMNINLGIIITLHRLNTDGNGINRLMNFIRWLGDIGVKYGTIHTLEVDSTMPDQDKYVIPQKRNADVFVKFAEFFEENKDLNWRPFCDIKPMLEGSKEKVTCYWNYCDPHNTQAVYGIEGDGALGNCGRTNKDGVMWYKSEGHAYQRYISFYHTPQNMGGCQGCRFWSICGGNCPGEAQNGDFRNKTIHCKTQKALLGFYEEQLEKEGIMPITKSPLLPVLEKILLTDMENRRVPSLDRALDMLKQPVIVEVKDGTSEL